MFEAHETKRCFHIAKCKCISWGRAEAYLEPSDEDLTREQRRDGDEEVTGRDAVMREEKGLWEERTDRPRWTAPRREVTEMEIMRTEFQMEEEVVMREREFKQSWKTFQIKSPWWRGGRLEAGGEAGDREWLQSTRRKTWEENWSWELKKEGKLELP